MLPVTIYLSTYNGQLYLAELLDSLLSQTYPNLFIEVRDDGSTDNTLNILDKYSKNHKSVSYYQGENVGSTESFIDILKKAKLSEGYFAFCDQDDIWFPDKLERAVKSMESSLNPAATLYFTPVELVSKDLSIIGRSAQPNYTGFENALVENVVTGATALFGSEIRDKLLLATPSHIIWHDWWTYLVASVYGEVIFDPLPNIQSRRHGKNQTSIREGQNEKLLNKFKTLIRVLKRQRRVDIFMQAQSFYDTYSHYSEVQTNKSLRLMVSLNNHFSIPNRIRFLFNNKLRMTRASDTVVMKALVLLGFRL